MKIILNVFLRRFLELLLPVVLMSAGVTFLDINSYITPTQNSVGMVLLFTAILYFMYNGYLLLGCYDDLYHYQYYISNISAIALFAIIASGFYFLGSSELFNRLFALTKTLAVLFDRFSVYDSMVVFYITILVITLVLPQLTPTRIKRRARKRF